MSRSRSAMLRLVAKRFEDNAPKELVATLSKFAEELEARKADGRLDGTEELRRIEHQRSLFAMLPDTGAVDRLREAMMQRAYDLMWDGDGLACDAVAEFLPEKDVDRMFGAWENDWMGESTEKSRFYKGCDQ